jgi:nucleotide-binding universal stress UspA family protein
MPLATSILCPIDFSAHADRALRHAVAIAGASGAHLTVLTVNDPLLVAATSAAGHGGTLRTQVQQALADTLANVPRHATPVVPALEVATGSPADEILNAAARASSDLIVMGTRGLGGASKLVFGSTAERVLRASAVPVLLIPEYAPDRMTVDQGVTRFSVRTVIAAIGLDAADAAVAATAAAWAHECSASLTLLHVCADVPVPAWWPFAAATTRERLESAMAHLDALARDVEGVAPAKLEVRQGAVDAEIAALTVEREAGLIAISRGGAHRLGSTAYRVVVSARVPTLVVPGAARTQ